MPDLVQIDDAGVRFGAIAHQIALGGPQIDRKAKTFGNQRLARDQRFAVMQRGQFGIRQHRLAVTKADLVQALTSAHQHRKRFRANLGIQRAVIGFGDAVKFGAAIGDAAGQQIKPTGRGFGVGNSGDARRQRQTLHQGNHVDAAFFQHRAIGQIDAVHFKFGNAVSHGAVLAHQKRRPHAVGGGA